MNATIEATATEVVVYGSYTVQTPSGTHKTYDIGYWKEADKYTLSLMTGSDNTRDFTGFAFIDLKAKTIKLYAKKTSDPVWAKHARIVQDFLFNSQKQFPGLQVTPEMTCRRCGRKLTTPISLAEGIGPECRKK